MQRFPALLLAAAAAAGAATLRDVPLAGAAPAATSRRALRFFFFQDIFLKIHHKPLRVLMLLCVRIPLFVCSWHWNAAKPHIGEDLLALLLNLQLSFTTV